MDYATIPLLLLGLVLPTLVKKHAIWRAGMVPSGKSVYVENCGRTG